jgi:hypothetical protein
MPSARPAGGERGGSGARGTRVGGSVSQHRPRSGGARRRRRTSLVGQGEEGVRLGEANTWASNARHFLSFLTVRHP